MGIRQDRLSDALRDIIANLFSGGQLSDPRLAGVSITAVKLSGDLQVASIYYRNFIDAIPDEDIKRGLFSVSGLLKHQISQNLELRRIPELRFFYDESIDRANRIESLLSTVKE